MILFNHCRPKRKKKVFRPFFSDFETTRLRELCCAGSITVDNFCWKLEFDGFSLPSHSSCFFFSLIPLKTACVQGVQIVECCGKSEPSHPTPPLAVLTFLLMIVVGQILHLQGSFKGALGLDNCVR